MKLRYFQIRRDLSFCGFTLIEMLLVLFAVLLLTHFAYLVFPQASEHEQVEGGFKRIEHALYIAQQYAIMNRTYTMVRYTKSNKQFEVSDYFPKKVLYTFTFPIDIFPIIYTNELRIQVTEQGSFSKSQTYYFQTPVGKYRLVLLLGQGRFYYEKM